MGHAFGADVPSSGIKKYREREKNRRKGFDQAARPTT
jgi:hypothetical protein